MSKDKELEIQLQFLDEAQEYLGTLEDAVLGLSTNGIDGQKINAAMRAAHSVKGGAGMMGFQTLSQLAHRLEDSFKVLKIQKNSVSVDAELEQLLLFSVDCLRQVIQCDRTALLQHRLETVSSEHEWLEAQALPVFEQLYERLGDPQSEDAASVLSPEEGQDIIPLLFQTEVEGCLQRLELVLEQGSPCLREEVEILAQELGGLGEMLQLEAFSQLCQSVDHYLKAIPEHVETVARQALQIWRRSQALVLTGNLESLPTTLEIQSEEWIVPEPEPLHSSDAWEQLSPELTMDQNALLMMPYSSLLEEWSAIAPEDTASTVQAEAFYPEPLEELDEEALAEAFYPEPLEELDEEALAEAFYPEPLEELDEEALAEEQFDGFPVRFEQVDWETISPEDWNPIVEEIGETAQLERTLPDQSSSATEASLLASEFVSASPDLMAEETVEDSLPEEWQALLAEAESFAQLGRSHLSDLSDLSESSNPPDDPDAITLATSSATAELLDSQLQDLELSVPELSTSEFPIAESLNAESLNADLNAELEILHSAISEEANPALLASEVAISEVVLEAVPEAVPEAVSDLLAAETPITEAAVPMPEPLISEEEVSEPLISDISLETPDFEEETPEFLSSPLADFDLEDNLPEEWKVLIAEADAHFSADPESVVSETWADAVVEAEAIASPSPAESFSVQSDVSQFQSVPVETWPATTTPSTSAKPPKTKINRTTVELHATEMRVLDAKPEFTAPKAESTVENTVRVPLKHLNQLNELFGELTIERNGLNLQLKRIRDLVNTLSQRVQTLEQVNGQLRTAYDKSSTHIAITSPALVNSTSGLPETATTTSQSGWDHLRSGFDVLEMDQFNHLHLLSQEVMETIVQIQEVTSDVELGLEDTEQTTRELNKTARQLQTRLTQMRMRPLSDIVDRFPRALREMSLKYGKPVELKIYGQTTLIDRNVLEALSDPLMHLLRNAFDHGIEDPETRKNCGKSEKGLIEIRASHRNNRTLITLSDDGRGIPLEKIRDRARQMGLDEVLLAAASDEELLSLIFEPGFSTKDEVTALSGRGVGMDVVRENLKRVRGEIKVETQSGVGTTFTLSVPMTLSVTRVLLAESNEMLLAFPTDAVEEIVVMQPGQVRTTAGNEVFEWEGQIIQLVRLNQWLHFRRPHQLESLETPPTINSAAVLILNHGNQMVGLEVERCWGEQEVAIRQVEGSLQMPAGFNNCTILGDGRVVPLVNITEMLHWINSNDRTQEPESPTSLPSVTLKSLPSLRLQPVETNPIPPLALPAAAPVKTATILIVDDSINVRRFLALTLEKAGYRVEQAKDGQDALDKLSSGLEVQAVICDIEMPRLDGYGFLARMKANATFGQLPVAMLTSRTGEKHRQLAMSLGASAYFSKPYNEQSLLQSLAQMTK